MPNEDWDDWDDEDTWDDEDEDDAGQRSKSEAQPKSQSAQEDQDISVSISPTGTKLRRGKFKAWEDEVIRQNWRTRPDFWIAEKIGRSVKAIEKRRRLLGYSKPNGRPSRQSRVDAIYEDPTEYNLSKLSKEDRIEFYKTKFDKNPRYYWLTQMLMPDEVEYYKHKYIEVMDSLDSINMQEEDLLHNMIMKEMSIIRINTRIKQQEEAWSDADDDDKPSMNMGLYRDLNDAEKQYVAYQEKLRLTREQRLKLDKEEKITISALVTSYMDARNREKAGRLAGVMAYSTEKCKKDMGKMNFLLGD